VEWQGQLLGCRLEQRWRRWIQLAVPIGTGTTRSLAKGCRSAPGSLDAVTTGATSTKWTTTARLGGLLAAAKPGRRRQGRRTVAKPGRRRQGRRTWRSVSRAGHVPCNA